MHVRLAIAFAVCLGLSTVSRADTIYTWSVNYAATVGPGSTVSLQFSVPSLLTTQTTITSFSSVSLGTAFGAGCSISDFQVPVSTSRNGFTSLVLADFASPCGQGGFTGAASFFTQPLTSDGVYTAYDSSGDVVGTLTISPIVVPEPATMALLGTGLMAVLGSAFFQKRIGQSGFRPPFL